MNTIKYRGLFAGTDAPIWMYGQPISRGGKWFIHNSQNECDYEVLPDTISQFTNMFDADEKEIYGGDIIECWSEGTKAVGEVKQRIDGLWIMYPAWQNAQMWHLMPDSNGKTTVKIIGNIHENSKE